MIYRVSKKCEKPGKSLLWKSMSLCWHMIMIIQGYFVYKKLRHKFPGKTLLFAPVASNGDICLFRYILPYFLEYNNIDEYVILVEKKLIQITKVLGFSDIEGLNSTKLFPLSMSYHFLGSEMNHIINFLPWEITDLANVKQKINFDFPKYVIEKSKMKKLCEKYHLIFNRTILLAPYEQTISVLGLPDIPIEVWGMIASRLSKKGYCLLTNCKEEKDIIKGTKQLFCPFSEINPILNYAGNLITIRSGLVDFTCNTNSRKIVFYPNDDWLIKWGSLDSEMNQNLSKYSYEAYAKLEQESQDITVWIPFVNKIVEHF